MLYKNTKNRNKKKGKKMNLSLGKNDVVLLLIRLFAGFTMFFAGFEKAIYTSWGGHTAAWSPAGSLTNGGGGIFHDWFVSIANQGWVGPLVYWGEMLIGLAILLGLTLRIALIFGIIENGLFWINAYMPFSTVTRSIVDGKIVETRSINTGVFGLGWSSGPLELNAAMIMMYICLFIVGAMALKYSAAGYLSKYEIVKKNSILKVLIN
jgi:thiosulfate dehydrogenase [quinone] large subunit